MANLNKLMEAHELPAIGSIEIKTPCAIIMPYNCMYFDEKNQQIGDLQCKMMTGLHDFLIRYPNGNVYWGIWRMFYQKLDAEWFPLLLKNIAQPTVFMGEMNEECSQNAIECHDLPEAS